MVFFFKSMCIYIIIIIIIIIILPCPCLCENMKVLEFGFIIGNVKNLH
jgi:hypothetical protein